MGRSKTEKRWSKMSKESISLIDKYYNMAHFVFNRKFYGFQNLKDDLIQAALEEMCLDLNTHPDDGRTKTRMFFSAKNGMVKEIDRSIMRHDYELLETDSKPDDNSLFDFSQEELPILLLRAGGLKIKEIQEKLNISRWKIDHIIEDVRTRYGYPKKPLERKYHGRKKCQIS